MSNPTIIPDPATAVANGKNGVDGTHKTHDAADTTYEVSVTPPATIVKRDGRVVEFDTSLIERALTRCFASFHHEPQQPIAELTRQVVNVVAAKSSQPTVEEVQDIVEMVLQAAGEYEAAKRYILYRAEHAKMRSQRPVPESVREAFAASDDYFPTQLQKFQFYDKYSRFNYELGRRETWIETVDRAVDFLRELSDSRLPDATYARVHQAILEMRALPSMRLLAMAGPAARRNNVAIYNCSYMPVDSIDAFVEALIISMSGCGVGFSVERRYVENFPRIRRQSGNAPRQHLIEDSSEGWADALRVGLETWFEGEDILFDYSLIRPAGAPLRTKGGRASGPEPLRRMLDFARTRILARQGGFLRPLDAHDMMCMVGEAAVSGGVRRCLPAGTRVHTRRGAIPIEEVTTNDDVMTPTGYQAVTGWFDQGVQDLVEIHTESGTTFRCTPHHRVAVLTDVNGGHTFKRADALSGNDRLLFITHAIDGEPTALLPLPEKRPSDHSGSNVHQPVLDTETAWFLGKFFADGYVRVPPHDERGKGGNTNFDVASDADETDQIERIARWMVNHGLRPRLEQPENEHCVKVRSSNRQIARWMHQYKQARTPLQIPEEIWRGTKDVRAAFIAGVMDGDGSVADRPTVIVHTSYPSFGREMVKLLATLGIIAEFRRRRPADEETGWQAMYYVSVKDTLALQKCIDTIGLFSCKKFVPRKGKQSGYTMPRDFVRRDVRRKEVATLWASSRGDDMNSATLATITGATHFVPVKVVEVNHIETQAHTYDIEVREGSMFVAEGYLVHNTAMISLFDHDDNEMRLCKSGDFSHNNSQRWNANNSAVWPDYRLSQAEIAHAFLEMVDAGRGEPGIFNRQAAIDNSPIRRKHAAYGTNPCGEILLKNNELCNLSIAVARPDDTFETLRDKIEVATIIGTIQSMAVHFPGLRPQWRQNCEEERLLGVDITGQMDSVIAQDPQVQEQLRHIAIETNQRTADALGIAHSAAITCVKPSGNSSQLLNCSPGLHTRWAPYYIRNVRVAAHSPIFKVLRDAGVPMDPENGQTAENANTWVIHFPVKSPDGAITRHDRTALEQCDYWLQVKTRWTEHNPSVTIMYRPDEILGLMQWLWQHQDKIGGMAFLPASDAQYDQMPYVEISEEEYLKLAAAFPQIDFSKVYRYEEEDLTTAAQELACLAGSCDIF